MKIEDDIITFDSWEEIKDYLSDPNDWNCVYNHRWVFDKVGMNCGDECCGDTFKNVDEAIERLKSYCNNKISEVHAYND